MNSLCNSLDTLSLKLFSLHKTQLSRSKSEFHTFVTKIPQLDFSLRAKPACSAGSRPWPIASSSASASEIEMAKNKQGVYAPKEKKVVVLWDLDNKPPRVPPYEAAMALRRVAERFGDVVEISAYANRHAFIHLPHWVAEQRRERRQMDILERKGVVRPSEPYVCGVCGRKCKTNLELKKHFKQLHERERQKKLNRMKCLKGKKRQKYKERYISGNHKYNEAARSLITPKVGYGLASELRRAGVSVKTVEDKPQAADWALKRQMQHSMTRGIDWLFLVSDDKDFSDMLRKAREANLGTVVVGDWGRALGRHADLWVPWVEVENGEVTEKDLAPRKRRTRREGGERNDHGDDYSDGFFSVSYFGDDLDEVVEDEMAFGGFRMSALSEGLEEEEEGWVAEGFGDGDYILSDSDNEFLVEYEEEDEYF